jgi:hypothetical protein
MQPQTTGAPAKLLEIRDVTNELELHAKVLDEMTGKLADRLAPALSGKNVENTAKPPRGVRQTQLGQMIDEANIMLERVGMRISNLLERLEL